MMVDSIVNGLMIHSNVGIDDMRKFLDQFERLYCLPDYMTVVDVRFRSGYRVLPIYLVTNQHTGFKSMFIEHTDFIIRRTNPKYSFLHVQYAKLMTKEFKVFLGANWSANQQLIFFREDLGVVPENLRDICVGYITADWAITKS